MQVGRRQNKTTQRPVAVALLRPIAYFLGVLMMFNALGHFGASIYWGILAPGTLSSPFLFIAAITLIVTTFRFRPDSTKGKDT